MAATFEKLIQPGVAQPEPPVAGDGGAALEIAVVLTSETATLAALKHAGALARNLNARVTLLVPQVVPFPRPLTSPPVLLEWNERRYRALAAASAVDTVVRLYLCRDREETLLAALPARSLVVIGCPKRWWRFTAERRLARRLRAAGHEAAVIETE